MTVDTVAEKIARVDAVCERFKIKDPKYVLNLDKTAVSFKLS